MAGRPQIAFAALQPRQITQDALAFLPVGLTLAPAAHSGGSSRRLVSAMVFLFMIHSWFLISENRLHLQPSPSDMMLQAVSPLRARRCGHKRIKPRDRLAPSERC